MTAENPRSQSAGFQGVLTVAAKSLQSDRVVHGLEQQLESVQVVEEIGLLHLRCPRQPSILDIFVW